MSAIEPIEPTSETPVAPQPRDAGQWAGPMDRLAVGELPAEALNRNVAGKRLVSPVQGFGRMWQKRYRVDLAGVAMTPAEIVALWKAHFGEFWPKGNRFYAPLTGIAPGEVAILNLPMAGVKLSTGVRVIFSDDVSFTFMNPEGHMFAGWITFGAGDDPIGRYAEVQVLIRPYDPLGELAWMLGAYRKEDKFWRHTLTELALRVGAPEPEIAIDATCVDRRRQWRYARNIWHNAGIRSALYQMGAPVRWCVKPFRRRSTTA